MIETLKTIAASIQAPAPPSNPRVARIQGANTAQLAIENYNVLADELDKLEADDFSPSVRANFLKARQRITRLARAPSKTVTKIRESYHGIDVILDGYLVRGSGGTTRSFAFVQDPDVRRLVERDFRELEEKLFPDKAWKSTIIMCGSILEAVLYDQLTIDVPRTMASRSVPMRRQGHARVPKDISSPSRANSWTLENLIDVSIDIGVIPNDAGAIHAALRKFRNLVHPRVELRLGIPIAQGPAEAAHGMLIMILDHLS